MNKGIYGYPQIIADQYTRLPDGVIKVIPNKFIRRGALVNISNGFFFETSFSDNTLPLVPNSPAGSLTTVESVVSSYTSVSALPNGEFVVAYCGASNYPRFGRYSAAGVLQGSLTTVESVASSYTSVSALPNGEFVVAYCGASNYPRFGRYSAAGVLQGSLTTVESVASSYTSVSALPNGEFVVAYCGASNYPRFGRYSAAGVLQGSLTTVESVGNSYISVSALPNGEFVVAYRDASAYPRFGRYNGMLMAIMGVALNAASSGGELFIATGGEFGRPKTFEMVDTFGNSQSFDHQSLGGTKGTIVGKTAYLKGLV